MLDALRRCLADQDAVVAAHVVGYRFVEAVAADTYRGSVNDAVQRDDGDFRRAAADVEHHGAARFMNGHAGADRRRHGLVDQQHLARARALGRLADCTPFHLRGAVGHANEHPRARPEVAIAVRLADEVLQHLLGDREIRDNPVLERPDRGDVAGCASQHVLGIGAHGFHDPAATARVFPDRHHRRLIEDDAVAP